MEVLTSNVRLAELGLDAGLGDHPCVGTLRNRDRARMLLAPLLDRSWRSWLDGVPLDRLRGRLPSGIQSSRAK